MPFDVGYYETSELRKFGFKYVGENVRISKSCTIIGVENIELGNNVRVDPYVSLIVGDSGALKIGSFVHIAGYCALYANHGIFLDDFCGLSSAVRIYSSSDDYSGAFLTNPTVPRQFLGVRFGAVSLYSHVIVGSGSVILPGVCVGEGAAIGALSLVKGDIDAWTINAGNPCRRIKPRSKELLQFVPEIDGANYRGG